MQSITSILLLRKKKYQPRFDNIMRFSIVQTTVKTELFGRVTKDSKIILS